MPSAFERAVLAGLALLRALPREPARAHEVRRRLAAFRREHPRANARLVTDAPGTSAEAAHDLLLQDGPHGTLALSLARDDGSPWCLQHAEHWAAQQVLAVDGRPLRLREALRLWPVLEARGAPLRERLVDEALLEPHLADDEVPGAEVQRATDALRRRLGLHTRSGTLAWLARQGLTPSDLEELGRREARRERWLERLFADAGRAHFENRRAAFERLTVCLVRGPAVELAELRERASAGLALAGLLDERLRSRGACRLTATLAERFAGELAPELRDAVPRSVVGPCRDREGPWIAQALRREASAWDASTRAAVRRALLADWLERARASADVRWPG